MKTIVVLAIAAIIGIAASAQTTRTRVMSMNSMAIDDKTGEMVRITHIYYDDGTAGWEIAKPFVPR